MTDTRYFLEPKIAPQAKILVFQLPYLKKIALRDDFCRSHHLSMILCTIKAKTLHVGVACGEGTIFEGTISQIFAEKGQFVQIVPSGGDKKTLCPPDVVSQ